MASTLEALNLEGAKSEELRSMIASVADATATDGSPRYSRRVMSALTRILVCRTYAKPTLEISHLIAAISDADGRFEHIVWGVDRALPSSFRSLIGTVEGSMRRSRFTSQGVVHLIDDTDFLISFSRMPLLAALIDFLISALGYQKFDELTARIRTAEVTSEDMGDVANGIQRAVYEYLKDHLPPAHRQKRERHFLKYVDERAGNRSGADAIADQVVLEYWQDFAREPTLDNKTYRSVYDMATRMILALEAATERVKGLHTVSIGSDREAGEVDPESIEEIISFIDPDETPLARVLECDDAVKFVTATEADTLAALPMSPGIERRIPVSILRNAVQGAVQLKISARLRRGVRDAVGGEYPAPQPYTEFLEGLSGIALVLDRILLAAFWALYVHEHPNAISVALEIAPDIDWDVLAGPDVDDDYHDHKIDSFDVHRAMRDFFKSSPDRSGDEIQALLAEARQAFKSINRRGFKPPQTSEEIFAMASGVDDVIALNGTVRRYIDHASASFDWQQIEQEDVPVFRQMFDMLYGADQELN